MLPQLAFVRTSSNSVEVQVGEDSYADRDSYVDEMRRARKSLREQVKRLEGDVKTSRTAAEASSTKCDAAVKDAKVARKKMKDQMCVTRSPPPIRLLLSSRLTHPPT